MLKGKEPSVYTKESRERRKDPETCPSITQTSLRLQAKERELARERKKKTERRQKQRRIRGA